MSEKRASHVCGLVNSWRSTLEVVVAGGTTNYIGDTDKLTLLSSSEIFDLSTMKWQAVTFCICSSSYNFELSSFNVFQEVGSTSSQALL